MVAFPVERITVMVVFILLFFNYLPAQHVWSLSVKSALNIPTEKMEKAEFKTGAGIEGTLSYKITSFLSAYAGWGWNKFSAEQSFAGNEVDFEETGYTAGVQFHYPTTISRFTYMVGVGAVYNHMEIEDNEGAVIADSRHEFGTQVETGVIIMAGKHFQFIPYARYRALPGEFTLDQTITNIDLRYFSFGLGLSWQF